MAHSERSNLPTSVAVLMAHRNAQMKHSLTDVEVAVGVDLRQVC